MASREVLAVPGGAGLDEQWVTLRRSLDVERAGHLEVAALVVEPVQAGGVGVAAGGPVRDDSLGLPAVPQGLGDLQELVGAGVALGVAGAVVEAEVGGLDGPGRGDDVPAGPAAADVVDGREPAGEVVRLVVRRRHGRDEADPAGRLGQRGEQRQRLELARRPELAGTDEGRVVREEQRVELGILGELCQLDPVPQVEVGPGIAVREPPRRLVVTRLHEERVEMEPPPSRAHEVTLSLELS
ncbi:hypothetical protein GCM10010390_53340 [Streptomyces mordarskii]|uniref:Uncharacterized protein n=1 Tax=Streptomyces mordarskii TaxID=1226758 RepID=A0ABN1DIL0_9ACTN